MQVQFFSTLILVGGRYTPASLYDLLFEQPLKNQGEQKKEAKV
jgi:hypothetical protein